LNIRSAWIIRINRWSTRLFRFEVEQMCVFENLALSRGYRTISGIDEAGRGALAGPVIAACVMLNQENIPSGIVDSKKISDARRRELFHAIKETALSIGIGIAGPEIIDEVNIYNATKIAMKKALDNMTVKPDFLLIDAVKLYDISISALSINKGEDRSVSIAAASIIAKVSRDNIMIDLSGKYPLYGFSSHKGYGTSLHRESLFQYGPTEVHRYSYKPVAKVHEIWKLKKQR
jgi:ribonuclease HII